MNRRRLLPISRFMLLGMLITLLTVGSARAVLIDGHIQDWERYEALPIPEEEATYSSALGEISEMKVTQDDDFIYVYLKFAAPRPFESPGRQSELVSGVWDDFSYLELDRNGDGRWDFRTRMMHGKRIGLNNLAILGRIPEQDAGRIVLSAEGHKDYRPLGPRAFFSKDGQAVEMRIPRLPLRLQRGVVYLRARARYRDDRSGASQWITRRYPSGEGWVAVELRPIRRKGEGSESDSLARLREPVIPRREFEEEVGPRYARYRTAYTYPWRMIEPSGEVSSRSAASLETAGRPEDGSPAKPPRSVIVVTPDGQVRQGAPGTSSTNPEEGQGVPGEVEAEGSSGTRNELSE